MVNSLQVHSHHIRVLLDLRDIMLMVQLVKFSENFPTSGFAAKPEEVVINLSSPTISYTSTL